MARKINRLSARSVATVREPGRHPDGGCLYLVVDKGGAKRWAFLFRRQGRLREMGLGGLHAVPLAEARKLAAECRALLAAGQDPIAARRAEKGATPTFGEFADRLIAAKAPGWRSATNLRHWTMTLQVHAAPIRAKLVDAITTEGVLAVLQPLWSVRHDTAIKLRGRIETVLDAAKAAGYRTGDNPARWRGHLDHLLATPKRLDRPHHAAMPFRDVPAFVGELRKSASIAALALEFVIVTAGRVGEVAGATWAEIDLADKVWTIPAARMKAGREHRVPLSERAVEILAQAGELRSSDFVFPSQHAGRPFSPRVVRKFLRVKTAVATVHGFRSAFRDWSGEMTPFPREIAEAALAHVVGDETERAYRRGSALEKRRAMMETWARFCSQPQASGQVIPLRAS